MSLANLEQVQVLQTELNVNKTQLILIIGMLEYVIPIVPVDTTVQITITIECLVTNIAQNVSELNLLSD